jgi:hypothetical protein
VRIIAIYFPATSQLGKEKTASYAKQLIDEAINKQWHIIIAGDFNAVSNPQLDKSQTNKTTKHHHRPTSSLLKHLLYQQFTDTFRSLHPYKMEYTWSNSRGHASRIDQIWISNSEDWLLTKAEIVPLDPVILPTDHNLMKCTIESWPLTQGQQAPRLRQPNDRYSWNSTSDLQWKKYNEEIERQLAAKIPDMKPNTEQEINHSWNIFRDTILKACANNITKIREKRRSPKTAKPQATHIILLNKLVHISKLCVREQTTTNHLKLLLDLNHQLLNKHHITIPTIPSSDANFLQLEQWHQELKDLLTTIRHVWKKNLLDHQSAQIKQFIQKRESYLEDNKKAMIRSILNRPTRHINLEKLIVHDPDPTIITDAQTIQDTVKKHYENWTTRRNPQPISNFPEWQQEYQPKTQILTEWYQKMLTPITTEELLQTIHTRSNQSAPGPSGIPYIAFKKLTITNIKHLCQLFNGILNTGHIPLEWKQGSIYPIPKNRDWEYNINITRPITLLETARKIFTKIINDRLASTFSTYSILSPNNWAALPGSSTQEPIHILQSVIDDAKHTKQQAWILSLDMSKAYDSVHIPLLELAMNRIKIPPQITQLIINIFENRTNTVITPFGPTSPYQVHDGIDQGDTISPLLWRIFYDPLITRLSKSKSGYTLHTTTHPDIRHSPQVFTQTISCSAYMDDTTLISNSKSNLQDSCDLCSQFFLLNDIHINCDKSHLIVINNKERQAQVQLQNYTIQTSSHSIPIRILGTWHNNKGDKKFQQELILTKTIQTCNTIRRKIITDKQLRYIINQVHTPAITYLLNDMVISDTMCSKISAKLGRTIKHKLNLSITTPNNAIYSSLEYGFFNISERQILHHSTNWTNRIASDNIAGKLALLSLQELQNTFWSTHSVTSTHLKSPIYKHGYCLTHDIVFLLRKQGYSIIVPQLIIPKKIDTTLEETMAPLWYHKHRIQLRKNHILFLSQCLNARNTHLLQWPEITKPGMSPKRKTPRWYTELEDHLLKPYNNTRQVFTNPSENIFYRYIEGIMKKATQIK